MTDISDPFIICSSLLIIGIQKNINHKTSLFPNSQKKNWWSILTIFDDHQPYMPTTSSKLTAYDNQ